MRPPMLLPRWLSVPVLCAVIAGCGATQPAPVTTPAAPAAGTAALPDSIGWVQRSAEYYAAFIQVYRLATVRVEQQAASRTPGTWAVILDADETILSNLQYQIERAGLGYSPDSWAAWVRRREATPLPGAAAFLARVRALGGRIAIVTNRLQSECADTVAVFEAQALAFDAMLCRPDQTPSDKNPRFEAVAAGKTPAGTAPLEVIAYIGDNILDFPRLSQALRQKGEPAFSEFGTLYFLVPNPMYGSWQETADRPVGIGRPGLHSLFWKLEVDTSCLSSPLWPPSRQLSRIAKYPALAPPTQGLLKRLSKGRLLRCKSCRSGGHCRIARDLML